MNVLLKKHSTPFDYVVVTYLKIEEHLFSRSSRAQILSDTFHYSRDKRTFRATLDEINRSSSVFNYNRIMYKCVNQKL